ncbi:hypothetical protein JX265_011448 [Neoarthrinium moseri]|uniref:Heterokaryon incompatibility domain-containing protein n=1 Tax=Neoarthrinium moseri TaxID=1658444 RepID=A0A9P9WC55_9PEZI|nr:uncharacterized protein JN550_000967 [Neoarthrinium moseri]KAI1853167.1 hypothetical protein JX266_001873 [Neoarthrinium moseri]KAI1856807.1 hypothetical protein JX265_011448 [Neoarthrinium moseri]KAI1876895.1 hypothetical protein JN550_000967 [Neoarthrinium moseri]
MESMESRGPSGVQFRKLDPSRSEIRLLQLQPADDIDQAPVARLINVALTDKIEYLAISCLLSGTETENIIINDNNIAVPASLGQILRHVRAVFLDPPAQPGRPWSPTQTKNKRPNWLKEALRQVKSVFGDSQGGRDDEKTLYVWFDALCIDHRNPQEEAQKLTHMGMVYRSAQMVVGWLGPKGELTDVSLEILQHVEAAMPPNFGEPEDKRLHPENYAPQHQWLQKVAYLWSQGLEGPYYPALVDFTGRPLFHRTWLIDEIAMARYPIFLIGDRLVSWKQVITLNRLLEELTNESLVFPPGLRSVAQSWPLGTVYTMLKHYENRIRDEEKNTRLGVLKQVEMKKQKEQAREISGAGEMAQTEFRRKGSIAPSITYEPTSFEASRETIGQASSIDNSRRITGRAL